MPPLHHTCSDRMDNQEEKRRQATGITLRVTLVVGLFLLVAVNDNSFGATLRSLEASTQRHHRQLEDLYDGSFANDDVDARWFMDDDDDTPDDDGIVTEDVAIALPFVALSLVHNLLVGLPSALRNWNGQRRCRNGRNSNCICTEDQLRTAIAAATRDRYNPLALCPSTTVELSNNSPINVTDKSFRLKCAKTLFQSSPQCGVAAVAAAAGSDAPSGSLFAGAPRDASFQDIVFSNGRADQGGAVHLTGGILRILRGGFVGNTASDRGGALYVAPGAEVRLLMNPYFDGNAAPVGRDVYIGVESGDDTEKASPTDTAYVLCKRAGYLVRPLFCQGVDGIAVGGDSNNVTKAVSMHYTNCHDPEHGEFSC